jgi:hypothetical protein
MRHRKKSECPKVRPWIFSVGDSFNYFVEGFRLDETPAKDILYIKAQVCSFELSCWWFLKTPGLVFPA